ncbi:MAG: nodulation protein NfeD [Candidatus Cloacimonetes bacterium]|nr:nodulation protein NfeD [Candidatus Cloacimonadota bacterium]
MLSIFSLNANIISVIDMEGMITAGQLSFLERELDKAYQNGSELFIIRLNTQGGLVDVTFKINETILNAQLPVAVYVSPSGAIAASAGAFIVLAGDIAAMAPGTTIGAAQPLSITPEGVQEAGEKTSKFLANHARSLAEQNNRPEHIAAGFVEDNLTLTATEALEEGLIDYIAPSLTNLLNQMDGITIEKNEQVFVLNTLDADIVYQEMKFSEQIQQWISNPQVAFLFLMLGLMGIYFGLSTPGTYVPEVLGALLLIAGIYGIGLFGTNTAGIIFLIAGFGLIIAEIFTSGFGILGIGGIISLLIGALILPHEPLMGFDWYGTFIRTVIGVIIGLAIILIFVIQKIIYSRRHLPTDRLNLALPQSGTVVEALAPEGMIKAKGELWKARSIDGSPISFGEVVEVVKEESFTLIVKLKEKEGE